MQASASNCQSPSVADLLADLRRRAKRARAFSSGAPKARWWWSLDGRVKGCSHLAAKAPGNLGGEASRLGEQPGDDLVSDRSACAVGGLVVAEAAVVCSREQIAAGVGESVRGQQLLHLRTELGPIARAAQTPQIRQRAGQLRKPQKLRLVRRRRLLRGRGGRRGGRGRLRLRRGGRSRAGGPGSQKRGEADERNRCPDHLISARFRCAPRFRECRQAPESWARPPSLLSPSRRLHPLPS